MSISGLSATSAIRSSALSGALALGAKAERSQRKKKSSIRGLSSVYKAHARSVFCTGWGALANSPRQVCQTFSSWTKLAANSLFKPAAPPASLAPPTTLKPACTNSLTSASIMSKGGKIPSPLKD